MEEKENGTDNRAHKRHAMPAQQDYSIKLRSSNEKMFHDSVSVNISYGGMMFISDSPYECNSKIEAIIRFSMDKEPAIVLQGVVKWIDENRNSKEDQSSYCIGIQFDKMEELQEIAFKIFIDTFIVNF